MEQADQFKGRLGFKQSSDTLLDQGLVQAVDMLEDYGHPPAQINARAARRIELECDQYRVVLRLRRLPLRMGMQIPPNTPAPAIFLDVSIERLFPRASDQEITELLLAVLLRRLSEALTPLVVFWQDAPIAMSLADFLGVFEGSEDSATIQQSVQAQAQAPITARTRLSRPAASRKKPLGKGDAKRPAALQKQLCPSPFIDPGRARSRAKLFSSFGESHHKKQARAHGQGCFASVDDTADSLEQKCSHFGPRSTSSPDQVIDLSAWRPSKTFTERQSIMAWTVTGLVAMLSAPIAVLLLLVELMRGSRLKPRAQLLTVAIFVGLLQGAGMVQAAARALWLPPN